MGSMEKITFKQADLLKGFVMRKTSSEITIKLRTGNLRKVKANSHTKRFKIGDEVLIGWDYEDNCIANLWLKKDIDALRAIPADDINQPYYKEYELWLKDTEEWGMGTFSVPSGEEWSW